MSVAEPVIDHLDPMTKLVYLAAGVREYHPVTDVYTEVRNLRRTDEELRKYPVMVTAAGNIPKGGGKATPRYIVMQHGWRIVPEDVSHTLVITGEQLTAEGGAGAACMDLTPLSPSSKVAVQYEPPAAEIIYISGGGGLTKADVDAAVWAESATGAQVAADAQAARQLLLNDQQHSDGVDGEIVTMDDAGTTPRFRQALLDKDGNPTSFSAGAPARRHRTL